MTQPLPTLTYSEAERVGVNLRRMWKGLSGKKKTPRLSDETWSDVVQYVLRQTRAEIEGREVGL